VIASTLQERMMIKKLLLVLALTSLLPFALAAPGYAVDPPAVDPGTAADPADPNAAPDPPDGTIDPNATYPTDGDQGTDQGEPVPGAGDTPPVVPPAGGNDAPD
jgi:hypothetical protein